MRSVTRFFVVSAALALAFASASSAQMVSKTAAEFPNVSIKNFGQMDTNYYRGGQPKKNEYQSLKALGVTTIIDLRNDPEVYEKPTAEALGMKYINIPMDDAEYPSEASIAAFLKEINDPANGVLISRPQRCDFLLYETSLSSPEQTFSLPFDPS